MTPKRRGNRLAPNVGMSPVDRHVRRRLRRAILAEARRLAREHDFGCRCFVVDTCTGKTVSIEPAREFSALSDLLHLCAQLDGRLPVDA